jgi:hypothetical protein
MGGHKQNHFASEMIFWNALHDPAWREVGTMTWHRPGEEPQ